MNRRTRKTLIGAALAAGLVSGAGPRALAAEALVGSARTVTINFVNTEIVDVLKALALQTGSNIVAGPEVKGPVSISMKKVDLVAALNMVTRLNNLSYADVDGTFVVAAPARLKEMYPRAQTTEIYTLTSMTPTNAVASLTSAAPSVRSQAQGASMVVLTGNSDDVAEARRLLAQMEGASGEQNDRQTIVHDLRYLNTMEAMRTLASILPDVMVTVAPGKHLPGSGRVGSEANGTSEIATSGGGTGMTQRGATTPGATLGETSVTLNPGEEPTALLLTGYPAALDRARDLLARLDIAPRQVEITARVVDLGENDALRLGLQYSFADLGISESQIADDQPGAGFASSSIGRVLSFGSFARLPFKSSIQLEALGRNGDSKILANPRIAAVDNRPARIFIGDTITAIISRDVTTTGTSVTTEKLHAGITLLVTPRVNGDGAVTLEVHPSVSALTGLDVVDGITLPRLSERAVDTTIRMQDGETIAIGGLIREEELRTMTKVPILGDIPLFGELFRHRNRTKSRSDVTIFITARVMPNAQ